VLALTAAAATTANAVELSATADTYTQTSTPTANFGSSGITAVAGGRTTLLRFNPTAIAQSTGGSATLKLKVIVAKNISNGVTVRLVTSSWNETTVNANNAPTLGTQFAARSISNGEAGTAISFDVSGALAGWRSNPATNFGLAIVAANPTPNLQLGSREGGAPAVLSITGAASGTNSVTVAPSGGDYTSPLAAADNALQGDHWCVSPQLPTNPCMLNIAAGLYYLPNTLNIPEGVMVVGAGRTATLLLASKGSVAVVSSRGRGLSDLSLINHQDQGGSNGLVFAFGPNDNPAPGANQITRVTIDVVAPDGGTGITTREVGDSRLEDVKIIVRGRFATGISQFMPPVQIVNSVIDVVGTEVAAGIAQQEFAGGPSNIRGTSISAQGPLVFTRGIDAAGVSTPLHISDSSIVSNGIALSMNGKSPITISHSTLRGDRWYVTGEAPITATDSILDGGASYGSGQATCSNVYDRSYQLLTNTCPAP